MAYVPGVWLFKIVGDIGKYGNLRQQKNEYQAIPTQPVISRMFLHDAIFLMDFVSEN
jgi:hypothetical protein